MRRAFRIVAGVLGVAVIGLSLPFAITSFTDDAESIHRLHFVAGVFAVASSRLESIEPLADERSTGSQ